MGGCVSISGQSACSSHSNGELVSSTCFGKKTRRRKRSIRTFADHVTSMQDLSSIPNRIFRNGEGQTSCIFTQQGRKGINQDSMIVWEDFMEDDVTFCGIFDGHGPHGHLVSRRVRDALPLKLLSFFNQIKQGAICSNVNPNWGGEEAAAEGGLCEDKITESWKEAFLKTYKSMDKELKSHPNLDCFCSGSTGVTIVKQGSNLFMGNIGDSRAIMGSKDTDDSLIAIQLTVDLKPDLPREIERITGCKGRVFALQDEPEVHRVWLPFDDAPGLAMARAFGDFCLKEYGVISVPEFAHRALTEKDQFIVLASDGVWDVLSNEEVVKIVSSASARSSAARILVELAAREWKLKYPTSKMDDCAVVCLFLDGKMDSDSDYDEQTIQENPTTENESDDGEDSEPCLQRNVTVREATTQNDLCTRLPADEVAGNRETVMREDQNWCGLEGVTRVNSLVQLPRFSDGKPSS